MKNRFFMICRFSQTSLGSITMKRGISGEDLCLPHMTLYGSLNTLCNMHHISHEHNSPLILGSHVYAEHSSCVLWTFRQTILNQLQPLSLESDHHVVACSLSCTWWELIWQWLKTMFPTLCFVAMTWLICPHICMFEINAKVLNMMSNMEPKCSMYNSFVSRHIKQNHTWQNNLLQVLA
jgi:hypothetical protein